MLNFDTSVCLVGNGELSLDRFEAVYDSSYKLVAADGGANCLREWGFEPDFVVGDLDSVKDKEGAVHIPDQDSTDLEKCLGYVEAPLFYAMGFVGKRFDHTLGVLHVLQKYTDKRIVFFSEEDVMFRIDGIWRTQLNANTRISFYPLGEAEILSSRGLKYPLDGLTMSQGKLIGTSNETTETDIFVEIDRGSLLVILPFNTYQKEPWN